MDARHQHPDRVRSFFCADTPAPGLAIDPRIDAYPQLAASVGSTQTYFTRDAAQGLGHRHAGGVRGALDQHCTGRQPSAEILDGEAAVLRLQAKHPERVGLPTRHELQRLSRLTETKTRCAPLGGNVSCHPLRDAGARAASHAKNDGRASLRRRVARAHCGTLAYHF
jgi:hypothetical protein